MYGVQFLNITPIFLSSACLAAASVPLAATAMVPLTSMYASLHLTLILKF